MKRTEIEKKIIEHFGARRTFSREELLNFYRSYEQELNNRTFGWRVFELKKKNIIKSIGRGIYAISYKPNFKPSVNPKLQKIYNTIINSYKNYDKEWETREWICVWSIQWLNEFLIHQVFTDYYVVEVEPKTAENVFFKLKEEGFKSVYYRPDKEFIDKYIITESESVAVKNLFSRSPLQKQRKIRVPTIEKILVDLFTEIDFYYAFQGRELVEIYRNSIRKYNINFDKLFNYARRRRRESEIKEFMSNNLENELVDYFI